MAKGVQDAMGVLGEGGELGSLGAWTLGGAICSVLERGGDSVADDTDKDMDKGAGGRGDCPLAGR